MQLVIPDFWNAVHDQNYESPEFEIAGYSWCAHRTALLRIDPTAALRCCRVAKSALACYREPPCRNLMVQRTPERSAAHLGLFLALAEAAVLPAMVQPHSKFVLKLLHATDDSKTIKKGEHRRFCGRSVAVGRISPPVPSHASTSSDAPLHASSPPAQRRRSS